MPLRIVARRWTSGDCFPGDCFPIVATKPALNSLNQPEAFKSDAFAKAIGLKDKYDVNSACVRCHATVFKRSADHEVSCEAVTGPGVGTSKALARTYAYVAAGAQGRAIVDIERPEHPRLDQTFDAGAAITMREMSKWTSTRCGGCSSGMAASGRSPIRRRARREAIAVRRFTDER